MKLNQPSRSMVHRASWVDFVEKVVELLSEIETELKLPAVWKQYVKREGFWNAKTRDGPGKMPVLVPSENAITHAIEETAEKILKRKRLEDASLPELRLDIQNARRIQPRIGSSALTTDIRIRSHPVDELEMRIEAKVLFAGEDLRSHYTSHEGLLRFGDSEAPYTDMPIGAMLSYRLKDVDPDWDQRIDAGLESVKEVLRHGTVTIGREAILASDLTWGSSDDNNVIVLHLGMDYETQPSCRAGA